MKCKKCKYFKMVEHLPYCKFHEALLAWQLIYKNIKCPSELEAKSK